MPTADDDASRWSREGVQQRILSMAPADALLTIEQYNSRHFRDAAMQLDPDICLSGLAPAQIEDVKRRVAELRQSATVWGTRYWGKRLWEAGHGIAKHGDDSEVIAGMSARHPGFSTESLIGVYNTGMMLAR